MDDDITSSWESITHHGLTSLPSSTQRIILRCSNPSPSSRPYWIMRVSDEGYGKGRFARSGKADQDE